MKRLPNDDGSLLEEPDYFGERTFFKLLVALGKGHLHRRPFGDMLRRIWALPLHGGPTGNGLTEDLPRGSGAGRGVLGKCPGNQGLQSVPGSTRAELTRPGSWKRPATKIFGRAGGTGV